ncbi:MAG: lamin tail domain-containing protein [Planctomycetales bacterium]|nr:lamin tail domain-containing protein [Planctomycetales bacterium]
MTRFLRRRKWLPSQFRRKLVRQSHVESLEARQLLTTNIELLPVQDITLTSATVGVNVIEFDSFPPSVSLYLGDEDGGEVAGNWDKTIAFGSLQVGEHSQTVDDLEIGQQYFLKAFGFSLTGNSVWTETISFSTLPPDLATLEWDPVQFVSATSVDLAGRVTDTGGDIPEVIAYFGQTDGQDDLNAWQQQVVLGEFDGDFSVRINPFLPNSSYFVRLGAKNAGGVSWAGPSVAIQTAVAPPLQISEVMAANTDTLLTRIRPNTEDNFRPRTDTAFDWIELSNNSASDINLSGYYLSDNPVNNTKWAFPAGTTIAAHSQLIVYASGWNFLDPAHDENGYLHTNFELSRNGERVTLSTPDGVAVDTLWFDSVQESDVSFGRFGTHIGKMLTATPGAANDPVPVQLNDVQHAVNSVTQEILVTATQQSLSTALTEMVLHYRTMFGDQNRVTMRDDGLQGDVTAGDGIYSALIPANSAAAGEIIRYYVSASDTSGLETRFPRFVNPDGSPEYQGLMVPDPSIESNLPVLHRFVEVPSQAERDRGTRGVVVYKDELYDNVFIRIRGGTARSWPKKAYKIEFNDGHHLALFDDQPRVDEINVNTTYTDKSYVRAVLHAEFQNDVGTPAPFSQLIRMQQNAEFFSVAIMVEQPDRDFLRRFELDDEGSFYKAGPGSTYERSTSSFEKKTRDYEDKSDVQDLITGLHLPDDEKERFLFDNVNLAAQINFMATNIITQNIDASDKNHYLYRDTNGTGEWFMLPWDLDLSFGPDALNTDAVFADQNTRGATYPTATHPYLGSRRFPLHVGKYNDLLDAMITNPRTNEMLLRRVRSLADEYLATGYFENRMDELLQAVGADYQLDQDRWRNSAHFSGQRLTMAEQIQRIKDDYLAPRLTFLTEYHAAPNGVGVPASQATDVSIQFGSELEFNAASETSNTEYFTLVNTNDVAVDLSGWQIRGATHFTVAPGTVILPGETHYFAQDVAAFRQRTTGPSGNQGLFVQEYTNELSDVGGQLTLLDATGRTVAETNFGQTVAVADAANLRISEIHYHPGDADVSFGDADVVSSEFEFIEVQNISSQPIELAGMRFVSLEIDGDTQGVEFQFDSQLLAPGEHLVVASNRMAFESRYGVNVPFASGSAGADEPSGQYDRGLSNGGETITLLDAAGQIIEQVTYDDTDGWAVRADGLGSSLERIPGTLANSPTSWRPSVLVHGSPGSAGSYTVPSVRINELVTATLLPELDQIEFFNFGDQTVDISGWFLTENTTLTRHVIPDGNSVNAGTFIHWDENAIGFALSSEGEHVYLIESLNGRPYAFVDAVDYPQLENNTSYARVPDGTGDFQITNRPTIGSANLPAGDLIGDFDQNGQITPEDIDLLCAAVRSQNQDSAFDVDHNQTVDAADVDQLIHNILGTHYGDVNLDGRFDSGDLVLIFQAGEYNDNLAGNSTWADGDWNCDGEFDFQDLVRAFQDGGYRTDVNPNRPNG